MIENNLLYKLDNGFWSGSLKVISHLRPEDYFLITFRKIIIGPTVIIKYMLLIICYVKCSSVILKYLVVHVKLLSDIFQ